MYIEPESRAKYEEFATANRDLENYLFVRGIRFHRMYRAEDCMVYWVYRKTPRFMQLLKAYQDQMLARVEEKRRKAHEAEQT